MLDARLKPFSPLIVPVCVAAIGLFISELFAVRNVPITGPASWDAAAIAFAETEARWWVGTTTVALLATAIGALAGAGYIVFNNPDRQLYRQPAIGLFAVLAATGAIFVTVLVTSGDAELGGTLFSKTIGAYPAANAPRWLGPMTIPKIADIASLLSAAALAVAAAALVPPAMPVPAGSPPLVNRADVDAAARKIARAMHDLKLLLFLAALVLVASLVQVEAWRGWPAAFWSDHKFPAEHQNAVRALVSFRAVLYVSVLAAIFMPPAIRLREAGRWLANLHSGLADEAARQRWLNDTGLALSFGEQAKRVVALISPFLALTASALFGKVAAVWAAFLPGS
jgi:hypothetical protein